MLIYSIMFRRPPTAPKQHHKSSASVGGSRVSAKIQFDSHQRALSVQIPTDSNALRQSIPSLNSEPLQASLTQQGTVLDSDAKAQPAAKNRRRRFANLFRSFRNGNDKPSE